MSLLGGQKARIEVTDPLAEQKRWAANTSMGNYGSFVQPRLGQWSSMAMNPYADNPLLSSVESGVLNDITGKSGESGPFSSLKRNLLGNFDVGQRQTSNNLQQNLQAKGLLGSGAGMAVMGNQGTDAARQRGLLGSQVDTQLYDMANQLGQQKIQDQISAMQMLLGGYQAPQFQNIDTTKFDATPGLLAQLGSLLGKVGGNAVPGAGAVAGAGAGAAGGGIGWGVMG